MRRFRISSNEATLELSSEGASDAALYGDWTYTAELSGPTMSVRVKVYDHQPQVFSQFISEIAESWKGWKDDRVYESLESSLKLVVSHDNKGYAVFLVEMRDTGGIMWKAIQEIRVELGQLAKLADDAVLFTK